MALRKPSEMPAWATRSATAARLSGTGWLGSAAERVAMPPGAALPAAPSRVMRATSLPVLARPRTERVVPVMVSPAFADGPRSRGWSAIAQPLHLFRDLVLGDRAAHVDV